MGISVFTLVSCHSGKGKLATLSVNYQSIRTKHAQPTGENPVPSSARIIVGYAIDINTGKLTVCVKNNTSEIMVIDQTMSFFVDTDGKSKSYFDPTVRSSSTTDLSSSTEGASVNLGAVAGALGIGGSIGSLMGGINVGGSGTTGISTTNTTYIADQPRVNIAPRGNTFMSKAFKISGIEPIRSYANNQINLTESQSPCRFSVCISYSLDGGNTFEKIVTDFYRNSNIVVSVNGNRNVSSALNKVYQLKPDAVNEYWWSLYFNNSVNVDGGVDRYSCGGFVDYQ
ncbi:MAG: hypothetical protein ACI30S_00655 [Muribaculaceae bacterium]